MYRSTVPCLRLDKAVRVQRHAPAALYPLERPGTHFTGGWVVPGPVWTYGKSRPHRHSIPDRPARSQSLYRLSYPAHYMYYSLHDLFRKSPVKNRISSNEGRSYFETYE